MKAERIAILDCGGQYTKVIDRRVRELSVRSEIFPLGVPAADLEDFGGIILSGGPASVWSDERPDYDRALLDLPVPFLGICYGMHLINEHFGGRVRSIDSREYGETEVSVDPSCLLFAGLDRRQTVLMSHGDSVEALADGFSVCARSRDVVAAIRNDRRRIYGVQFHPEVDLTVHGRSMLESFLRKVCGLEGTYRMEDRIQASVDMIRSRVGNETVLVLVSGGVDSAVTAALLLRALDPGQVIAIHVDHGLMRKGESDAICRNLHRLGLERLVRIDAWERFHGERVQDGERTLPPLAEAADPEEKRLIIGNMFVRVVEKAAADLNLDFDRVFLAQGTLRPDLIESGNPEVSGYAHRIKTHHNDVDLIRQARARGRVIETNWDWHKDEVRDVARRLGIDEAIASRQPFPGPGLAIRCLCTREAPPAALEEVPRLGHLLQGTGYRGTIVPLKTVGVQGDNRSYRHLALLEGEQPDWKALAELGGLIPNRLAGVNRVGYVLRGSTEGAVAFPALITLARLDALREIDELVREVLDRPPISQVFAVLFPFGAGGRSAAAIRAVITNDYMTGRPAWPGQDLGAGVLEDLADQIMAGAEVSLVAYDVTGKPPATVEWE